MSIFGPKHCEKEVAEVSQEPRYITIWAEESGKLSNTGVEYSFGSNAFGGYHAGGGYVMLTRGRIVRGGITSHGKGQYEVEIEILINGQESNRRIIKPTNLNTVVANIQPPINLVPGQTINFKSKKEASNARSTIVTLLIELK